MARRSEVRHGGARQGTVRRGGATRRKAVKARRSEVTRGKAWQRSYGWAGHGKARQGPARQLWQGAARNGMARLGEARQLWKNQRRIRMDEFTRAFKNMHLALQTGRVAKCLAAADAAQCPDFKKIWRDKAKALRQTYERELN